jgi:hypothetical protein
MKYRVKVVTDRDGYMRYIPQRRGWLWWMTYVSRCGDVLWLHSYEQALGVIEEDKRLRARPKKSISFIYL